jgi:murein DD-endopeptidase MepM/ murein hydrolase activator NlpD
VRDPKFLLLLVVMLVFSFTERAEASSNWRAPIDSPELVKEYRQPASDYSAGHRGVDYLVKEGQPVFAPASAEVAFVGKVVNRGVITLKHGATLKTSLEPVCSELEVGERVLVGERIGAVCNASEYENHCKPRICLHFALRTDAGYLSPLVTIGGLAPSRLLPIKP